MKTDENLMTVEEISNRFRLTPDAIYAWIRKNVIPPSAIHRTGKRMYVRRDMFNELLDTGKLYQNQRRRVVAVALENASATTRGPQDRIEHRYTDENGNVLFHPWEQSIRHTTL